MPPPSATVFFRNDRFDGRCVTPIESAGPPSSGSVNAAVQSSTDTSGFRKILYEPQSYPDNYCSQEAFLSSLRMNTNLKRYRYWPLVAKTACIAQHLSVIAIFVIVWLWLRAEAIEPPALLAADVGLLLLGYSCRSALLRAAGAQLVVSNTRNLAYYKNIHGGSTRYAAEAAFRCIHTPDRHHRLKDDLLSPLRPPRPERVPQTDQPHTRSVRLLSAPAESIRQESEDQAVTGVDLGDTLPDCSLFETPPAAVMVSEKIKLRERLWEDTKSALHVFGTLWVLSPILQTLTSSWSEDTIIAVAVILLVIHALIHDYAFVYRPVPSSAVMSSSQVRQAWLVDSTVGLNAAMFAAIILASRLRTPDYVFAFAFFAMLAFAFIPFAFKWVYDNSRNTYTKVLTPGICFVATLGLWMQSKIGAIAFQVLIALMCFACPYLLIKSQCYKTEMRGPWDIAIVKSGCEVKGVVFSVAACEPPPNSEGFRRPGPPLEELVLTPPDPVFSLGPAVGGPDGARHFIQYGRHTPFVVAGSGGGKKECPQKSLAEVCLEGNNKHRLAGLDFDAVTRMPTSLVWYDWIGPSIEPLDGSTTAPVTISGLPLGDGIKYAFVKWSPQGDKLAVTVKDASSAISLYIIDVTTGKATRIAEGYRLNAATGACPYLWSSDGKTLLLYCVPESSMKDIDNKVDRMFAVPEGPVSKECHGKKQEARTYASKYLHSLGSGGTTRPIGSPSMVCDSSFSPDDRYLLVTEITGPPFSRSLLVSRFGRQFSVLSLSEGQAECFPLYHRPAQEDRPNRFDACAPGPRGFRWVPTKAHTLAFVVADGDGGDPRRMGVDHRDTAMVMREEEPWDVNKARVLFRSEMRMQSHLRFTEEGDIIWREWRFKDKTQRVWMKPHALEGEPTQAAKGIEHFTFNRNASSEVDVNPTNGCILLHCDKYDDAYTSMGHFETVRGGPFNRAAMAKQVLQQVQDGSLVLFGDGASDQGLRPFVDYLRVQLDDTKTKPRLSHRRVWRCCLGTEEDGVDIRDEVDGRANPVRGYHFEEPIRLVGDDGGHLLFARESITQPRERFLRDMTTGKERPVTVNKDPRAKQKALFDILAEKKVIHYKREDGVDLTATLYIPKKAATEGRPPPCIVWAYPESYSSQKSAGQVRVSKYRFNRATWARPLLWISKGWAVLDNPSMPIIGDGDTANDTFIQQLVMNGEAAVAAATASGGVDPARIAVGGHSYGGFMTANLIAHTRPGLFRAGIGRSGAYNRSLTPFGFQREERNYWDATEVYQNMSPFTWADKIAANKTAPLLLIHGQSDTNSGTAPNQSEGLFGAIKGLGGIARLCMLPKEGHHYKTIEGVMHATWEMDQWLTRYVLNAEHLPEEKNPESTSTPLHHQPPPSPPPQSKL
ncbi:hypothetical protein FOL47_008887 [Perkinsus chesapeaki]|uniref:Peptidase S9 prolyl oligopeptidase catalytic domain-containing protein n=1 Tax=Perkinsus chesapeaki TaxID=330153 RepID=A0A7J6LC26_PERCH|nr:hypothetical protein FOL47_008887 [Perkinsus chesapeaki]